MTDLPRLVLVDSHCHIDLPDFDVDREEVLARARAAGLAEMLIVGGVDETNGQRRALEVAARYGLPASAGVHPHEARVATEATDDELRGMARDGRLAAIGEIGLDFHYDHSPRDVQREVFVRLIALARAVNKPIIVHTREAAEDTLELLEREGARDVGGIIHCFSEDWAFATRAFDLDFDVSFSGIVTFKKTVAIQDVAARAPDARVHVETDSPYLAPVPFRGKPCEPAYVVHTAKRVAELRGVPVEVLADTLHANAERRFRRSFPKAAS